MPTAAVVNKFWDKIWNGPSIAKGQQFLKVFTDYIHRNVVAAHPLIKTCTLQKVLGTGTYGYVFQCYIVKCDKTAITCAVKIKLCITADDVDYYNSALTAAKNDKVISQHLPIIEKLDDWYLCKELVAPGILQNVDGIPDGFGWPCGVIFMEMLPREITQATETGVTINDLCKLTQALCDATIYYPDLKTSNVMLRADDDTPILVDLDAFLIYHATYYDLHLGPTYFPFNMEYEGIPLQMFQPRSIDGQDQDLKELANDFKLVAKYTTVVAGICTAMHYFFTVAFNDFARQDMFSLLHAAVLQDVNIKLQWQAADLQDVPRSIHDIVRPNYIPYMQTSYETIVKVLEEVKKNAKCTLLISSPAYRKLTEYILSCGMFSDSIGVEDSLMLKRFGEFYACRACFTDVTF